MRPESILLKSVLWLETIALLSFVTCAQAAVFCSASSPGFSSAYVPSNVTTNMTSTTFAVTCSRDNAGPRNSTVRYQVAADSGLNALGNQNRATLAGSFLNYRVAIDGACATRWRSATVLPTPRASFTLAKNTTITNTYTYFGCIPAGQPALPPAGTYTDTVTMTFALGTASGGAATFTGGTFPVSIIAPASCNLTAPPSNVTFTYTGFSPAAVLASSAFGVTCTTFLTYTMALDATIGVVAGLNYSLALNTAGTGGINPLPGIGNGGTQTFFINGTMAADQAGTCAAATCAGSQVHTLTITY